MAPLAPLPLDALCPACDAARFPFASTAELTPLERVPGQERALEALEFGTGMRHEGYNLFVMGPPEVGKRTLVREGLERRALTEAVPADLGYLHNFAQPWRPRALRLAAGRMRVLRTDLERLVEDLKAALPASLEGEAPRARKQAIEDELKERHDRAMGELRDRAEKQGIGMVPTPLGVAFVPLKDGDVLPTEAYEALPPEERTRLDALIQSLQSDLKRALEGLQEGARAARDKLRALRDETLDAAVEVPLRLLLERWADEPEVVAHLVAVRRDVVEHAEAFFKESSAPDGADPAGVAALGDGRLGGPYRRYLVNVLVDREGERGAPVVYEPHATLTNLVGRTEHVALQGALLTDFQLIKPGALHRADGGYLVLEARDVLTQPYAWEGLKRALKTREVRLESLGQMLSLVSTVSLEPEPFPIAVKVILLGERSLHALLDAHEPDFRTLFKVVVDFEEDVPRTPEQDALFARLVGTVARRDGLLPLSSGAVARVLERAVRAAGDAGRLSAHMGALADLLRQSDWWARQSAHGIVQADDVDRAVTSADRRLSRVRERLLEETLRGTLHVETQGARVGQVNGLAVLSSGTQAFGRPARISARVRMGRGEVLDIEREVELGGPLHTKGVLILSAFVASRYALDHPLSLSASLVFEQSYGPIDGDSASSAELYALLSALAELPLAQGVAVTGSVDQHGRVQPIGGVNEKVEGFFDLCAARGLNGTQGVLVPATNVRHLVLDRRVRDAVAAGRFHVWGVATIDEGIEVLTGVPAGERDATGRFPASSVNALVEERLLALARRRLELGGTGSEVRPRSGDHPGERAGPLEARL